MAVSLLLVATLLLFSMDAFSNGGGNGATSANPSILSRSRAESQTKLCAEGRDSTYGDPPSAAQQAQCVRALLGQASGGGASTSVP
jgi:hypothetical protein